jgi:GTP-binding protein Era
MVERETKIGPKQLRCRVDARADLEKFFGKQIHIELYVKVNKIEKQRKHVAFCYNHSQWTRDFISLI